MVLCTENCTVTAKKAHGKDMFRNKVLELGTKKVCKKVLEIKNLWK